MRRGEIDWRAAVYAGIAAGIIATWGELLLWWLAGDPLPETLYRDARLAAAIAMGRAVLPPPASFDAAAMAVATLIHFTLSIGYTLLLAPLVARRARVPAVAIGTAFGLLLFTVNMYGFTALFPWFRVTRDAITLISHGVFGAAAAFCYDALARRRAYNGQQRQHGDRTG